MTTEATEKHFINDCGVSMKHRMIIPSLEELHKYDIDYDLVKLVVWLLLRQHAL